MANDHNVKNSKGRYTFMHILSCLTCSLHFVSDRNRSERCSERLNFFTLIVQIFQLYHLLYGPTAYSIFQQIQVFACEIRFWCNIFSNNYKMNNILWNGCQSLLNKGSANHQHWNQKPHMEFSREMEDSSGIHKTQHQETQVGNTTKK